VSVTELHLACRSVTAQWKDNNVDRGEERVEDVLFEDVLFERNSGAAGGAVAVEGGRVSFKRCVFNERPT
jgi:predicted outer membrane repeat protein